MAASTPAGSADAGPGAGWGELSEVDPTQEYTPRLLAFESELLETHARLAGLSRASARTQYLEQLRSLPFYGCVCVPSCAFTSTPPTRLPSSNRLLCWFALARHTLNCS